MRHSSPPAVVSKPARPFDDQLLSVLSCPDCEGEGCGYCLPEWHAVPAADESGFALDLCRAVPDVHLPPASPPLFALWEDGFYEGSNGIPCCDDREDFTPEERAAWWLGYSDGVEVYERECEEEAARLMEEAREFPPHCYAGFGIDANEYEGR